MYEFIRVDRQDAVAILTLNRPERFNAWHSPMRHEVIDALNNFNADDSVKAAIITGAGDKAFCAGQDLAETQTFVGSEADAWMNDWAALYGAIRALDKPLIAALNGLAAGSAFQVALQCDIRVGHPGVQMGQTEIRWGIPSITGAWVIGNVVGPSRAAELILTGRMVEADECRQLGLIHEVVPQAEVLPKALEIARKLASMPPLTMKLNKQRLREISEPGFRDAMESGHRYHLAAFSAGEPQSMMAKFFEERAARKSAPTQTQET